MVFLFVSWRRSQSINQSIVFGVVFFLVLVVVVVVSRLDPLLNVAAVPAAVVDSWMIPFRAK